MHAFCTLCRSKLSDTSSYSHLFARCIESLLSLSRYFDMAFLISRWFWNQLSPSDPRDSAYFQDGSVSQRLGRCQSWDLPALGKGGFFARRKGGNSPADMGICRIRDWDYRILSRKLSISRCENCGDSTSTHFILTQRNRNSWDFFAHLKQQTLVKKWIVYLQDLISLKWIWIKLA